MPIPQPRDGDGNGTAPAGPATKRHEPSGRPADTWLPVPGRPGFYSQGGRLKYDPAADPTHPLYRSHKE